MGQRQESEIDKFFDKLTLANDFVFKMVLENEEICRRLIEMVLGRKVIRIVSLETEKTLSEGFFSHTVRFDVYVEGSSEVIDFEIRLRPSGRSAEFCFAKHRNARLSRGFQSGHEITKRVRNANS